MKAKEETENILNNILNNNIKKIKEIINKNENNNNIKEKEELKLNNQRI